METSTVPVAPVKVYVRATGSSTETVLTAITSASGTCALRVTPKVTSTYTAKVVKLTGYTGSPAPTVTVTVS